MTQEFWMGLLSLVLIAISVVMLQKSAILRVLAIFPLMGAARILLAMLPGTVPAVWMLLIEAIIFGIWASYVIQLKGAWKIIGLIGLVIAGVVVYNTLDFLNASMLGQVVESGGEGAGNVIGSFLDLLPEG